VVDDPIERGPPPLSLIVNPVPTAWPEVGCNRLDIGQLDPPRHDRDRDGRSGPDDAGAQSRHQRIEEARRQALARLPIGRMGTVTDIAKGIVVLASDDAGFMTGSDLVVDGGITAQ
jgi:NAD(P)-dependent dehydrogenase (short-subunit alcohol dehydrogenase family)